MLISLRHNVTSRYGVRAGKLSRAIDNGNIKGTYFEMPRLWDTKIRKFARILSVCFVAYSEWVISVTSRQYVDEAIGSL